MRIAGIGETIRERYSLVVERINQAAFAANRDPEEIRLVVVTKTQPVETIQAAIDAGARTFGENYAEQAVPKIEALGNVPNIEWHMIGHIQSRKARLVMEHFDMIHSIDSIKLVRKLNGVGVEVKKTIPVLIEINLGDEPSKSGWPVGTPVLLSDLFRDIKEILDLPNIQVTGLMTMPPLFDYPEKTRPYFRQLRNLQNVLKEKFPEGIWCDLSMGTSGDFDVAVQEGATLVRVGQAILGPRPRQ